MSVLTANKLSLSFGARVMFADLTFTVGAQDRCALVGPNGSGKSTLLNLLAQKTPPDSGEVMSGRGARVGYLPQELGELAQGPLLDTVLATVPGRSELDRRLHELEAQLPQVEGDEEAQLVLAARLAELHEELADFDERFGRHRAAGILEGLGFSSTDFERPASEFSGGWRMRAALAGLLLQAPDVLLLDEPTNHLDIPSLAWFENFLLANRRALVLVSHDREFLERQTNRILALEPEGLRSYSGSYTDYLKFREQESKHLEARAQKQAKKREQVEGFIERFGAKASKARQARSMARQLAKEEEIELLQERAQVAFRFPPVERSGREVLATQDLGRSFGEHVVHQGLNLSVQRGERIAIVGVNGAGKTTLLKLLAGELEPSAGEVKLGHKVSLSYYAQHHSEQLDRSRSILEELAALVPEQPQSQVRATLGAFLFRGDDVEKRIAVLSGGERARVALAKLLVIPSNLMLMDEPTNHLDLDSSEALISALEGYEGTLIFVSHNRSFINRLATRVWDVRPGGVSEWPGNLDDYLRHLALEKEQAALAQEAKGQTSAAANTTSKASRGPALDAASNTRPLSDRERRRLAAEARQAQSRLERPLKEELSKLEAQIAQFEEQVATAEAALSDPDIHADYSRAAPHIEAQSTGSARLEELYERWAAVGAELEELREKAQEMA